MMPETFHFEILPEHQQRVWQNNVLIASSWREILVNAAKAYLDQSR